MVYLLFILCVAQGVALFLFWNLFREYRVRSSLRLRNLEKDFDSKDPVIETLRIVIEKFSDKTKEDMKGLGSHLALLDARVKRLEEWISIRKRQDEKKVFIPSSPDKEML